MYLLKNMQMPCKSLKITKTGEFWTTGDTFAMFKT